MLVQIFSLFFIFLVVVQWLQIRVVKRTAMEKRLQFFFAMLSTSGMQATPLQCWDWLCICVEWGDWNVRLMLGDIVAVTKVAIFTTLASWSIISPRRDVVTALKGPPHPKKFSCIHKSWLLRRTVANSIEWTRESCMQRASWEHNYTLTSHDNMYVACTWGLIYL